MLGSLSFTYSEGEKTTIAIIDGSSFGVKFLQSESHDWRIDVTSHPVEKGSDITDHIQPQPRTVVISGRESEASLNLVQILSRSGSNRVDNAKSFFHELYRSRKPVMITSRLHTYERMVATSITQSTSVGDGQSLPWSVTFQEITLAESQSIQLAKSPALTKKKGTGSKTVKAGKKPPVPATAAEAKKVTDAVASQKGSMGYEFFKSTFGGA